MITCGGVIRRTLYVGQVHRMKVTKPRMIWLKSLKLDFEYRSNLRAHRNNVLFCLSQYTGQAKPCTVEGENF